MHAHADHTCEENLTSTVSTLPVHIRVRPYKLQFPSANNSGNVKFNNFQRFQLRLVQPDNRGGFCDCWGVTNLTLSFRNSSQVDVPLM